MSAHATAALQRHDTRTHSTPQIHGGWGLPVSSTVMMPGSRRWQTAADAAHEIQVAEWFGQLHDGLKSVGYPTRDLGRLLIRLMFCLFADDAGVFGQQGRFLVLIRSRARKDGTDLGAWLLRLFEVLGTPPEGRTGMLDPVLGGFPNVNGRLFEGRLQEPPFDVGMRQTLIDACCSDWSRISPVVFGALLQSVMDPARRRALGAHYTSEEDILKVIGPLFLDGLRGELLRLRSDGGAGQLERLRAFHGRLRQVRVLDPACGCGNFLVMAYRELRELEVDVMGEMKEAAQRCGPGALEIDWGAPLVDVDQCYGIEIDELPARIAEVALWVMDHLMNRRIRDELGQTLVRIPLQKSPHIVHGDALEMDWSDVLPAKACTAVIGNPPFVGSKLQSEAQRAQVRRIANLGGRGNTLDYVAAWFIKAAEYVQSSKAGIGFVATSSIVQGQQTGELWPVLFDRYGMEIAFAYRPFPWQRRVRGAPTVHVIIVGLERRALVRKRRQLFSYEGGRYCESGHRALSPYLTDATSLRNPHLVVTEAKKPVNGMRPMAVGSQPIDGGHYIFGSAERKAFLEKEPAADEFLRPYVGGQEFLLGKKRWILVLHHVSPEALARLPEVRRRIDLVRAFRAASRRRSTLRIASVPRLYQINMIPERPFLAVPETSTARRRYVPVGWLSPPVVPNNALRILEGALLWEFALITSAMHMAWLRHVGGRLGMGYRYSVGMVYNTFPLPPDLIRQMVDASLLRSEAQAVLDARAAYLERALASLYDRDQMPRALLDAHHTLDRAVDRLYREKPFIDDHDRLAHLFALHEGMVIRRRAFARGRRLFRS